MTTLWITLLEYLAEGNNFSQKLTHSVCVNIKNSVTAVNAFCPSSALFPREVGVGVLIEKM